MAGNRQEYKLNLTGALRLPQKKGIKMKDFVKVGNVFAANLAPDIHNEIVHVYKNEDGRTMAKIYQYGATLATENHQINLEMWAHEIRRALGAGHTAHVILVRDYNK
jgi:hypothetical protein